MIQRVHTELVDDLDGQSPADETVHFALDGVNYEIDLSRANADRLRDALRPWQEHARTVHHGRRRPHGRADAAEHRTRRPRMDPAKARAIRDWAAANGMSISARGKIPAAVHEAYRSAHR